MKEIHSTSLKQYMLIALCVAFSMPSNAVAETQGCLPLYYMKSYQQALPACQSAAKQGHIQAQYALGSMYLKGKGTLPNKQLAYQWFKAASEQGHAAARYKLQHIKRSDQDTAQQPMHSSLWVQQLPRSNKNVLLQEEPNTNEPAIPKAVPIEPTTYAIKTKQYHPEGVSAHMHKKKSPTDLPITSTPHMERQHKKAINNNITKASNPLDMGLRKTPTTQSEILVFQHYLQRAKRGNAHHQLILGLMYHEGRGITKNDVLAISLFKQAARQGLKEAQLTLALMFYEGYGTEKNEPMALQWFTPAAQQGSADAQYSLGLIYASSSSFKDEEKAVQWWKKAAVQEHVQAQHNLALMYLKGLGVPESRRDAAHWFQQEAKHGDPVVQFNLAQLYSDGHWLNQDGQRAASWFYRAGANHLARGEHVEAIESVHKIKLLSNQKHLNIPNGFLADVLNKQIQEAQNTR